MVMFQMARNGNKFLTIDKGDSVLKKYVKCFLELNTTLKKLMMVKL